MQNSADDHRPICAKVAMDRATEVIRERKQSKIAEIKSNQKTSEVFRIIHSRINDGEYYADIEMQEPLQYMQDLKEYLEGLGYDVTLDSFSFRRGKFHVAWWPKNND